MDTSMIEATQALEFDDDYDDANENDQDGNEIVGYLNVPCQKGFPGKQYPVTEGENVIGRGDHCPIYIPLKGLSREHACIEVKGENHFIYDKGSRNKTKRNNFFLSALVRYELKDGEKLIFGDVNCSYKIGEQIEDDNDTGSETGSESMFETAPSVSANGFTICETPAQPRPVKRFMDNLTVPESDSEPDDDLTKTVTTLEADTQDTSAVNLMGAPTQAFVCESDVTTDDDDSPKKSILTAATQAYNMDTASSDEDSPSKRRLLSAATQAFVADSDESPPKKAKKTRSPIDPTLKYDMPEVIESTQGYDMEGDAEGENEDAESRKQLLLCQATQAFKQDNDGEGSDITTDDEKDESDSSKLMAQPTQAFFADKQKNKDKDNEEIESESSEDFVLEGDTDNEDDSEIAKNMFAAPTLACDDVTDETEVENDQTVEVDDKTLAVCNEAMQAIVDKTHEPDTTVALEEDATQAVVDKTKEQEATVAVEEDTTQAITDMATQIVSDASPSKEKKSEMDATQVIEDKGPKKKTTVVNQEDVVTQVLDNDSTQALQETNSEDTSSDTQTFLPALDSSKEKVVDDAEMATQVLGDVATLAVENEESNDMCRTTEKQDSGSFDITAASTLAPSDSVELSLESDKKDTDATQVFDNVDIKDGNQKDIAELETQVFDNTTAKVSEEDQTMAVTDDTVPPISETVQVSNIVEHEIIDATVPITDEVKETVPISDTAPISDPVSMETVPVSDTVPVNDHVVMETVPVSDTVPVNDHGMETVLVSDTVPVNDCGNMDTVPVDTMINADEVKISETSTSGKIVTNETEDDCGVENAQKGKRRVKQSNLNKGENKDLDSKATYENKEDDINTDNKRTSTRRGRGKKKEESSDVTDNQNIIQTEGTNPTQIEQPVTGARRGKRGKSAVKPDETVNNNNKIQRMSGRTQKSEDISSVKDSGDSQHNLVQGKCSVDKTNENSNKGSELEVENTVRPSRSRTKKKNSALDSDTGQDKQTDVITTDESGDKAQSIRERGRSRKAVEPVNNSDPEPATQAYFEEQSTQIYKDSPRKGNKVEEPTQRYGADDDSTQSLSQIEDDESNPLIVPKPAIVSIPSRSPLKSAMASPEKKKKSPSPKRVQFISQNSDSSTSTSDKQIKEDIVENVVNEEKSENAKNASDKAEVKPSRKRKSVVKNSLQNDSESSTSENQKELKSVESDKPVNELVEQLEMDVDAVPRRTARGKVKNKGKTDEKQQMKSNCEDIVKDGEHESSVGDQNSQISKTESRTRRKTKNGPEEKIQEANEKKSISRSTRKSQLLRENEELENEKGIVSEAIKDTKEKDQRFLETDSESGKTASEISMPSEKTTRSKRGTGSETKDNVHVTEKPNRKRKTVTQETPGDESKSERNSELSQIELKSRQKTKTEPLETIAENTSEITKPSRGRRITKELVGGNNIESGNKKENQLESKTESVKQSKNVKSKSETLKDNSEDMEENLGSRRSRRTKSGLNKELETESTSTVQNSDKTESVKGKGKSSNNNGSDNSKVEVKQNQSRGRRAKDIENKNLETENTDEVNSQKSDQIRIKKGKKSVGDKDSESLEVTETKQNTRKSRRTTDATQTDDQVSQTSDGKDFKQDTRKSRRTNNIVNKDLATEQQTDKMDSQESDTRKSRRANDVGNKDLETEQQTDDSQESDKNETVKGKKKPRTETKEVNSDLKEESSDNRVEKTRTNVKLGESPSVKTDTGKKKEVKEKDNVTKSIVGRRGEKRKGTDDSSSDSTDLSQNEGTPAKKQKLKDTSTPKNTSKQIVNSAETPKSKSLDTSITDSPTLRKTTTSSEKPKVMFTGVTDEQGEKIVKELGGELVNSVTECTHLVTDQIRRTVKFLCCLARGIPIISPQWLISSKKCGFFSDTAAHLIHDDASEKKFKCSLHLSLSKANDRPMLEGYKIHVTKSVKPGPDQMKDILKCAGAQRIMENQINIMEKSWKYHGILLKKYLTTMPKSSSPTTLVISCDDDKSQCDTAVKNGITVVNAEFILTGILRQEVDVNSKLRQQTANFVSLYAEFVIAEAISMYLLQNGLQKLPRNNFDIAILFNESQDKKTLSQEPASKKRKR